MLGQPIIKLDLIQIRGQKNNSSREKVRALMRRNSWHFVFEKGYCKNLFIKLTLKYYTS
jgi:hypothetical protein